MLKSVKDCYLDWRKQLPEEKQKRITMDIEALITEAATAIAAEWLKEFREMQQRVSELEDAEKQLDLIRYVLSGC